MACVYPQMFTFINKYNMFFFFKSFHSKSRLCFLDNADLDLVQPDATYLKGIKQPLT